MDSMEKNMSTHVALLAELMYLKDEGVQKLMVKGGAAVDPESGLQDTAHILQV